MFTILIQLIENIKPNSKLSMSTPNSSSSQNTLSCSHFLVVTTSAETFLDVRDLEDVEADWFYPYGIGEVIWGICLAIGIFGVNLGVLWIVIHARELWKPRHLWMACLCVTDLFVGVHKVIELLLLILPPSMKQLCIINKATLGIPYILNILLLTLLSLDRYIAVSYPYIYASLASNKHVGIGFLLVLLTGSVLSWSSITIGLQDVICRVHFVQLKYLIVTFTICSILTLFFNVSVLRIAKKQLTAIYSSGTPGQLSLVCTNCGYQTATNTVTMPAIPLDVIAQMKSKQEINDLQLPVLNGDVTSFRCPSPSIFENITHVDFGLKTSSLPELVPMTTEEHELNQLEEAKPNSSGSLEANLNTQSLLRVPRRCRSLFSFNVIYKAGPQKGRVHFFRHWHFNRIHIWHIGRLFPSIRFARTVLLIMIPMWIFIFPVIVIIPLHSTCEMGKTHVGCSVVDTLWTYLLVHIRSVLLLQAILDTVIYACRSKEFKNATRRIWRKEKCQKRKNFNENKPFSRIHLSQNRSARE